VLGGDSQNRNQYRSWPTAITGSPHAQIDTVLADDLAFRVLEGVKALPRRGLEVGGLLVGSYDLGAICADELSPILCAYPEGPGFTVSEAEFGPAVESARARGRIVGLYRSRTDGSLDADEQDVVMLRKVFEGRPLVFLVIRQSRTSPAEARLGLWTGSGIEWTGPSVRLQTWLHGSEAEAMTARPALAPVRPRTGSYYAVPAAPAYPAGNWRNSLLLPGIGITLIGIGIMLVTNNYRAEANSRSRTADPYIVNPDPRVSAPVQDVTVTTVEVPEVDPNLSRIPVNSAGRRRETLRLSQSPASETPHVRPFRPPPAAHVPGASELARITPPQIPANPDVSALPALTPSAPMPMQASSAAAAEQGSSVAFTPPILARQPGRVVLPPDLRRVLQHEVVLSLKVNVDSSGRVTSVSPVYGLGKIEQSIWRAYSSAVSTWEFEPATQNGARVPAETILKFRVVPSS